MKARRLHELLRVMLQPATIFGLSTIAICWIGLSYFLAVERTRELAAAIQDGTRLTHLIEENSVRLIKGVDRTLLLLRSAYEKQPEQFDLQTLVKDASAISDVTTEFALIGSDGYLKAKTGYNGPPIYVGDLEHFQFHFNAESDQIYISKPFVLRTTGAKTILISRRLHKSDGTFGGTIVASIAPRLIEEFYQSLRLPNQNTIVLFGFDGAIRASYGRLDASRDNDGMPSGVARAQALSPTGYFWGKGGIDGVQRLVFYRTFTGYPLLVTYGKTEHNILADFQYHQQIYMSVMSGLTLLIAIVMFFSIRRQSSLDQTNMRFCTALENMKHGLCMFDANRRLVVCNRHYAEIYRLPADLTKAGTPHDQIIRHRVMQGILKGERSGFAAEREVARLSQDGLREESRRIDELADGRLIHVVREPMQGGGWVATHEDVTEQKRSESRISYLAHHDGLTGLANRVSFVSSLEEAGDGRRRWEGPFNVLMLDLDRFKDINDTFGHPVGDAVLTKVAERLKSSLRETDVVARLGGDEFAIIQPARTSQREAASALAMKIVEIIAAPFEIEGKALTVGTSIGIALAPEHGIDPDALLKMADLALYRAKSEGRNGYCFFSPEIGEASNARHVLESDLRQAIAQHQFEVQYQPIVDVATRNICCAEALVRWNHPQKGLVFPDKFIPLAEETGLITQIGEWVLLKACTAAMTWPTSVKVAVNLSPVQIRSSHLIDTVTRVLAQTGLPAQRLELEITETALIADSGRCAAILRQLKALGVTIALDDFGTGYSSLSHLTTFPIDRIKIDRSFTRSMTRSAECAAIISATMTLAHSLSIATTAEGVETRQQFSLLKLAGVSAVQGYLFNRPCRESEIDFDTRYDDQTTGAAA